MRTKGTHNYYIYILTNRNRTVLYTGVTNDLKRRLDEHCNTLNKGAFTSKYNCFYLIYYEHFTDIREAIKREKQIKGWTRLKKENLISGFNKSWEFLNDSL